MSGVNPPAGAELHAHLAQWRASADHVANTLRVHADLAQGCVEVADDDALIHHAARAINAARALARIVNEITNIRADAGLVTINIRAAVSPEISEAAE